ncbi:MAG: polysaccharide biosynthesis tyrosine autokinase [Granulosicoccus sp.]
MRQTSHQVGDDFWAARKKQISAGSFDPLDSFRVVLRYKWLIILAAACALALAFTYIATVEPEYRSTQSLLLDSAKSNIVDIENLIQDESEGDGYVQTRIEMLTSRDHAKRVIDGLGLLSKPVFVDNVARHAGIDTSMLAYSNVGQSSTRNTGQSDQKKLLPDEVDSLAIKYFQSNLTAVQVLDTRLVRISYQSNDNELASAIANEVGLQFIADYVESNRSLVTEVSGWLGHKLSELKTTLEESESQLLVFKSDNELINVSGSVGKLSEQELLLSAQDLSEARLQLSNITDLLEELRSTDSTQKILDQLPSMRDDPLVQQTRIEISQAQHELEKLSNQYGPRHPSVVAIRSELLSLQAVLRQSVLHAIESAENEHRLMSRRVVAIKNQLDAGKRDIQNAGVKTVELEALEKEVQTNRDLYSRFFSRMIEARSTQGLESVNATITEYASPSLVPDKPDKAFILTLTLFGALLASTIAVLVINGFDDSIKRLSDVEQTLGEKLVGIIPYYRRKSGGVFQFLSSDRWSTERSNQVFVEAFKTARTNLLLDQRRGSGQIILLTSSVPGEGKSMSAVCLARSFAQVERVLLIDADIRRPSLSRALKLKETHPGLTNFIAGQQELSRCIQHCPSSGFDVLCSGSRTDQPLELLSSRQFASMLQQLAQEYERIVIDSAPVEAVSDALLLSKLSDQIVYVAKSHDSSIRLVSSGLEKLRSVDAPLAGVLLTQVDLAKLASYGADYEFHGYYDYYGYATSLQPDEMMLNLKQEELHRIHSRKLDSHEEQDGAKNAFVRDTNAIAE